MLLYINLGGDMGDIMSALNMQDASPFTRRSHCSGLLRLLDDNSDIYIAQVVALVIYYVLHMQNVHLLLLL